YFLAEMQGLLQPIMRMLRRRRPFRRPTEPLYRQVKLTALQGAQQCFLVRGPAAGRLDRSPVSLCQGRPLSFCPLAQCQGSQVYQARAQRRHLPIDRTDADTPCSLLYEDIRGVKFAVDQAYWQRQQALNYSIVAFRQALPKPPNAALQGRI